MFSISESSRLLDVAPAVLRIGVGVVFALHGNAKRAMWMMQPSEQLPANLLSTLKFLSIVEPLWMWEGKAGNGTTG